MAEKKYTNQRQHSRIPFKVFAELSSQQEEMYSGYAKDFSFGGMYLTCDQPVYLPSMHVLTVKIFAGEGDEAPSIELECQSVRSDSTGFAIRFLSISREQFNKLKKVIYQRADNPEELLEEHRKIPGFEVVE